METIRPKYHQEARDRQQIIHSEVALSDTQAINDFLTRVQEEAELFEKRLNAGMKALGMDKVSYSVDVGSPIRNEQVDEDDHYYVVMKASVSFAEEEPAVQAYSGQPVEQRTLNAEARPIIAIEYEGVLDEANLTDDMVDFIHEALNTHEVAIVSEVPDDYDRRFENRNEVWHKIHARNATSIEVASSYLTAWTAIPAMTSLIVSPRAMRYEGSPPDIRKIRAA